MKALAVPILAVLALSLGACWDRPEDDPGLEDAIPVDEPEDTVNIDMPVEDSMVQNGLEPTKGIETMESEDMPPAAQIPPGE